MPVHVASAAASPSTVASGGQSVIALVINNQSLTATVSITSPDGSVVKVPITVSDPVVLSTNPAAVGDGKSIVATVDQGGTLVAGADGKSFDFNAS